MPVPLPQVRRIENNDEQIGMGFNSESGLAVGTALEGFEVQVDPVAPGLEVDASITIVNSHEDLMKRLGMSFEAQGRYGLFSASAKAQFSESSNYNSTSTFLVARCIVQNPFRRGKNFRVTEPAKALLTALRFDEFKTAFGDSFVRGLQTGGEFYAVIRITSISTAKQTELATTLQAEYNGLVASGEFKAQFTQANASASTRSEYSATMFQRAGSGAQSSPTVEISEVITRFKNFPEIASTSAFPYETEVATYDTLPLPVPTPEEQDDFLFALRDAREKKLRYIQTRNDLEFALRNPLFFETLPTSDVLLSAISVYAKLINAVLDHAIKLSRGQMRPPRVFDPGVLVPPIVEPLPIPLKRIRSEGLKLVANPHSFPHNIERISFDVPDNFQATVKLTVDWGGPVAAGFGRPGMYMSARVAGIGLLSTDGKHLTGTAIRAEASGVEIGYVSGELHDERMFDFVSTPYFGGTVYLRHTVGGPRRQKPGEFSSDGQTFTQLRGGFIGRPSPPVPGRKLVLFAWSRDDTPVKVAFSAPTIVPITT